MAETAGGKLTPAGGRGHVRAAHADREQAVDTLKAAFAYGRLTRDEFDARLGRALEARTYADLSAVVAGLPAAAPVPRPQRRLRRRPSNARTWAASGLVTPGIVAAAGAAGTVPADHGYAVFALVIACAYFLYWLSAGTDLLWEWHSTSFSPSARACVRCAHTVSSHRTRASCSVRAGSLQVWTRCECAGYVPPGVSPRAVRTTA